MLPILDFMNIPTQPKDHDNFYTVNGGVYLISPSQLRSEKSFFGSNLIPLKVDSPIESVDIDTEWDFLLARIISEFLKDR